MDDQADLSRLADIVVPLPVALWPPAPGWWIVGAALLVAIALAAAALLDRHRRNAYRRAALAELDALGAVTGAAEAAAISSILKRAALSAYPRDQVASLTGGPWLAFLDRTSGDGAFTSGPAAGLAAAAFDAAPADGAAMMAAARRWVKRHPAVQPETEG